MPKSVPTPSRRGALCGLHKRKICLDKLRDGRVSHNAFCFGGTKRHTQHLCLLFFPGHTGDSVSQHPTIVRCVKRSSEPFRLSFSFSTLYLFVTMAPTHITWAYGCLQATWIVRTQADPWASFTCLSRMASGGPSVIILGNMGLER